MQQAEPPDTDLEVKLAGFVRTFIQESRDQHSAAAQEALRWVCAGLEHLLGARLEECERWSGWVDGVDPATDLLPDAVQVISGAEVSIRGRALWGKKAGGPFLDRAVPRLRAGIGDTRLDCRLRTQIRGCDPGTRKVPLRKTPTMAGMVLCDSVVVRLL
jgi:hypothetical protein